MSLICQRPFSYKENPHNPDFQSGCWYAVLIEFTDQLSVSSCCFFSCICFIMLIKEAHRPARWHTYQQPPVIPVTFLISSELLSMPAVKRFSVSFARHPTNGMSVFIQVYFDNPPVHLLSCMTLWGENIFYVFFIGVFWHFDWGNDMKLALRVSVSPHSLGVCVVVGRHL